MIPDARAIPPRRRGGASQPGIEITAHGVNARLIAWPGNGFQTESVHVLTRKPGEASDLYPCDIVISELFAGLHARHREQGGEFLASMRFLTTSSDAARQAGTWSYDFRSRGIQLTTTDCLIAAVALDHQATLVTGNVCDFPMPALSVLPLPRRPPDPK